MRGKHSAMILMLITFGLSHFCAAQSQAELALLDSANTLYDQGEYTAAAAVIQSFVDQGIVDEAVYYNLGNCFFKVGDKKNAVLYYEKALKINSGNEDAAYNLSVVNGTLIDQFEELPSFSTRPLFAAINGVVSSDFIALLSILCLVVAVIRFYVMKKKAQNFTFTNSWVLLVVACFLYLWGAVQKDAVHSFSSAVVSINGMEVHSEPKESSTLLFELNEGTKVELVKQSDQWYNVKTKDGNQGWVQKKWLLEI
jgi:tetratricopeptide (TPR) repeat protein